MEKSKYANVALILALLSLVSPIISILTSQGMLPKVFILGTFLVSGTGFLGLILGILGYNETEQKWKSITAIVIYVVGTLLYFIFGYAVMVDAIMEIMFGLIPLPY